jgi:hypothetical protein
MQESSVVSFKEMARDNFKKQLMVSGYARFRSTPKTINYKNILTKDEAAQYCTKGSIMEICASKPESADKRTVSSSWYFYTDNYLFGLIDKNNCLLPSCFVPSSTQIPTTAVARKSIPDGWIHTLKDYEAVFHSNDTCLQTIDELLDVLQEHFGYFV